MTRWTYPVGRRAVGRPRRAVLRRRDDPGRVPARPAVRRDPPGRRAAGSWRLRGGRRRGRVPRAPGGHCPLRLGPPWSAGTQGGWKCSSARSSSGSRGWRPASSSASRPSPRRRGGQADPGRGADAHLLHRRGRGGVGLRAERRNAAEGRPFNAFEKPWMEAGPNATGRKAKESALSRVHRRDLRDAEAAAGRVGAPRLPRTADSRRGRRHDQGRLPQQRQVPGGGPSARRPLQQGFGGRQLQRRIDRRGQGRRRGADRRHVSPLRLGSPGTRLPSTSAAPTSSRTATSATGVATCTPTLEMAAPVSKSKKWRRRGSMATSTASPDVRRRCGRSGRGASPTARRPRHPGRDLEPARWCRRGRNARAAPRRSRCGRAVPSRGIDEQDPATQPGAVPVGYLASAGRIPTATRRPA